MFDRGLALTLQSIRRQLAAMPHELYLIRLIHHGTGRPFPGERLWTADQLTNLATIRFLRVRNREGCDVYIQPYAGDRNAGYILVDLDRAQPTVVATMRANGHEPCVVLQTSPGHLQAWVHVSPTPLEPVLATAIGRQLARLYGGDRASTDWRHLGRLAGFTNQKPQRRTPSGYAPWVKIVHTAAGLARCSEALSQLALERAIQPIHTPDLGNRSAAAIEHSATPASLVPVEARQIYQSWMRRWQIARRFAQPDWSIVDLWVARALLAQGTAPARVQAILRLGSPQFPRGHSDPDDYLRRTLARAFSSFPAPGRGLCAAHACASTAAAGDSECSNSTGGR
jgi:RepB DNA-primase N-terminal domain/RepB DNA-primase C-terminal helical domain